MGSQKFTRRQEITPRIAAPRGVPNPTRDEVSTASTTPSPPGVSGISPERVDSLLGQPASWRLPAWLLAASVGALSALGLVVWWTSGTAAAQNFAQ